MPTRPRSGLRVTGLTYLVKYCGCELLKSSPRVLRGEPNFNKSSAVINYFQGDFPILWKIRCLSEKVSMINGAGICFGSKTTYCLQEFAFFNSLLSIPCVLYVQETKRIESGRNCFKTNNLSSG